ncbi:response regulator transcription factor [Deinococcus knuensis]|nr:response regulator transcription factor [Deinococcus knuensis]
MPLILVVEDEPEIAEILEGYLRRNQYQTERAADGRTALEVFRAVRPDLILLDVMLPGLDGVEVLRAVRAVSQVPVIMLSARAEEVDKLIGLELGADDYVTKPFSPREVLARVKTVLRRAAPAPLTDDAAVLRVGALEVDPARLSACVEGRRAELSATEFRLLYHLARSPGRVFSREELLEAALPDSDALERVVDSHLRNLRRKLEDIGGDTLIETVRGVGYRLAEPHA